MPFRYASKLQMITKARTTHDFFSKNLSFILQTVLAAINFIGVPEWNTNMADVYNALYFSEVWFFNNLAAMRTAKWKCGEYIPLHQLHNLWVCWCFWCKQNDLVNYVKTLYTVPLCTHGFGVRWLPKDWHKPHCWYRGFYFILFTIVFVRFLTFLTKRNTSEFIEPSLHRLLNGQQRLSFVKMFHSFLEIKDLGNSKLFQFYSNINCYILSSYLTSCADIIFQLTVPLTGKT